MKKVFFFILLLATAMVSNGQSFILYNSETKESAFNGKSYLFDDNVSFTLDTALSAPYTITAKGIANPNAYYISGFGNGNYTELGELKTIGYSALDFDSDYLVLDVFTNGYEMGLFVWINMIGETELYGCEIDLSKSNFNRDFTKVFVPMNLFSKVSHLTNMPDEVSFLTSELASHIYKLDLSIVKIGENGTGSGEIQFKDMYIGAKPVITSTLLDISNSFVVSPNPANSVVNFGQTLTNVNVYNANGILVETMNSASSINVSTFKSGVYFINATEGATRFVVK